MNHGCCDINLAVRFLISQLNSVYKLKFIVRQGLPVNIDPGGVDILDPELRVDWNLWRQSRNFRNLVQGSHAVDFAEDRSVVQLVELDYNLDLIFCRRFQVSQLKFQLLSCNQVIRWCELLRLPSSWFKVPGIRDQN